MNQLNSKTAVVIGGGTGIGLGCALALAELGAKVVIAGRREDVLEKAVAAWTGEPTMVWHTVDVAERTSVDELFGWVSSDVGPVDILVNAAGVNIKDRSMAAMQPEEWDRVLAINTTGAYNCLHAVLPGMRQRQNGLIINISSVAGKRALDIAGVAYCASKFAMTALGTALSNEEAKNGIRVTNIYPGEVNTPLLDQRPAPVSAERRATMLQPEDIGQVVALLATLPPHAHVPELVIKPLSQTWI
jgi:NADP-dependent 3-hydroxy acid dehydrogenase YdfG